MKTPSMTFASIKTLETTTGASEEQLINDLTSYFASVKMEEKGFLLDSPMSVTVKRYGKYSKVPLIGGETFTISGAYMGKRDGVIIKMISMYEGEWTFFEMPAHVAEEHLEGYTNLLQSFVGSYGLDDNDEVGAGKSIEDEAHADAILKSRMNDHRFGSW